ncbi:MAG: tRNA dihydrouridine synthase DusB [Candidatus Gastranaerophilales bacterium]|nr:tRNA dihydrouridine synthase DusB [Candidatus Gastranaerophilales bacterium]
MEVCNLIKSKVSLAPMAGITDYVLRSLVRKYSQNCLLTTEMISSEALTQVKDVVITKRDDNHSPISYQLSGHKPEMIANCAKYLEQFADMIDINMGCPVGKVVKGNDGCALMRNDRLAYDIVQAVKEKVSVPVSVKFRLGYTTNEMNFVEFGGWMQEAGADFITIHGRTRNQMYAGHADWKKISELKKAVDIPVFANGDVNSIESAEQCLEESGANGIAIGRAAIGDPSLIYRIEHFLATGEKLKTPTLEEKIKDLKTHLDEEIALRGENVGLKFVRKFYPFYINGVPNAAKYRSKLVVMDNYKEILSALDYICKMHG